MSDYSRQKDFSVKDALPSGDANKKILGSDVDSEFDAVSTSNNTKANKVASPTDGAYMVQDSNGDAADGGVVISAFIDTVLDDASAEAARATLEVSTADTGSLILPVGTVAQRDGSPVQGYLRANSDNTEVEWYNGSGWAGLAGTPDVMTTQGDMIRGGASGAAERFALGGAREVLMSDGTDPTWGDVVVRATAQATTSGTAFDFTGVPSWVTKIYVAFNAVSLTAADDWLVQIGDAGGIETTAYASASHRAAAAASSSTSGFLVDSNSSGYGCNGVMILVNVSGNIWVASHSAGLSTTETVVGGGVKTLSDTLTQVRLTRSAAATFDAGSVTIIYE